MLGQAKTTAGELTADEIARTIRIVLTATIAFFFARFFCAPFRIVPALVLSRYRGGEDKEEHWTGQCR